MTEKWSADDYAVIKERIMPTAVLAEEYIENSERTLCDYEPCVTFRHDGFTKFEKAGSWILLDFGKEMCGGIRLIVRAVKDGGAKFRITFGESASEACTDIGVKGSMSAHSPRDFIADVCAMSDVTYGQTGFRFVRIELLEDKEALVQNIYAINTLPYFADEAVIKTSDEALNKIIATAAYTIKLNCQNGYIWDGIKRDRLVWSGDLHQEILTSLYLFGDNKNVTNSLSFLRKDTDPEMWINEIPSYSAWWVISFCDYCRYSGNEEYFNQNRDFADAVMKRLDSCVTEDGEMKFDGFISMFFFLDWPTYETEDAITGTAMIIRLAAEKLLEFGENESCRKLLRKLECHLSVDSRYKQTRALQILTGRKESGDREFIEKGFAEGFSTFMAYYILKAYAEVGGEHALDIIKEYFGGMLSRGATTFWEDFHLEWLEGSGRIDRLPENGEYDIHGDYGDYCYKGFRHSLCHGWSSGVLSFIIENVFGINIGYGCKKIEIKPRLMGLSSFEIHLPLKNGALDVRYENGNLVYSAPEGVEIDI